MVCDFSADDGADTVASLIAKDCSFNEGEFQAEGNFSLLPSTLTPSGVEASLVGVLTVPLNNSRTVGYDSVLGVLFSFFFFCESPFHM